MKLKLVIALFLLLFPVALLSVEVSATHTPYASWLVVKDSKLVEYGKTLYTNARIIGWRNFTVRPTYATDDPIIKIQVAIPQNETHGALLQLDVMSGPANWTVKIVQTDFKGWPILIEFLATATSLSYDTPLEDRIFCLHFSNGYYSPSGYDYRVYTFDNASATNYVDLYERYDLEPPSIEVVNPVNDSCTRSSSLFVLFTVEDNVSGISSVELKFNGILQTSLVKLAEGVYYWTTSGTSEGSCSIEIAVVDCAGNPAKVVVYFTWDNVYHMLEVTSPAEGETVTGPEVTISYSWIDAPDPFLDHFEVKVDDSDWVDNGKNMSYTANFTAGEHVVYVRYFDCAGNSYVTFRKFSVEIPTPKPKSPKAGVGPMVLLLGIVSALASTARVLRRRSPNKAQFLPA